MEWPLVDLDAAAQEIESRRAGWGVRLDHDGGDMTTPAAFGELLDRAVQQTRIHQR